MSHLNGTNFGKKMEIQHGKLVNAKFLQYANKSINGHGQHKMLRES